MSEAKGGGAISIEAQDMEELQRIVENAAAMIACVAAESGQDCCSLDILGLRCEGQDIGDWTITAKRKRAGVCH